MAYIPGKTEASACAMWKYRLRDFAKDKMPLSISFQKWSKGGVSPEHLHDSIEIIYVVKGDGANFIDGRGYPIIPGDIYIVNCGSTHAIRSSSSLWIYNLMFMPSAFSPKERALLSSMDGFSSFFSFKSDAKSSGSLSGKLFLPPPFSAKFKSLFERLHQETLSGSPGWRMNCKAYLILIVTEICRSRALIPDSVCGGEEDSPLGKALAFVNANYLHEIQLSDVAKAAGLSPNYISEFFRERTGVRLVRYISLLRVEKARQELLSGKERSVAELARSCGFDDPSYFSKVFKELAGSSPTDCRAGS